MGVEHYRGDPVGALKARSVRREDGCLVWAGATTGTYGQIMLKDESMVVHRFSWMLAHRRPVPDDHDLHHTCGEPLCLDPDHLEIVTRSEHQRLHPLSEEGERAISRANRGEGHGGSKLTAADVRRIRERFSSETAPEIASDYPVSKWTIYDVARGRSWRHI